MAFSQEGITPKEVLPHIALGLTHCSRISLEYTRKSDSDNVT